MAWTRRHRYSRVGESPLRHVYLLLGLSIAGVVLATLYQAIGRTVGY